MENTAYYQTLIKPFFAPPSWVFGPVWSVLYLIIFVSFGFVFYKFLQKKVSINTIIPFALNLVFNFLFTPIQFGLQNNLLASVDILLVLVTIVWFMLEIKKHYKWVAYINIPYLMWVTFATIVQLTVTYLNY